MDKKTLKEKLTAKLKQEMSTTGTGASVTPGVGAGVATKYAFAPKKDGDKIAKDYIKTFGGKLAPSIPNRPSKAMDYKELWEVGEYDSLAGILKQLGAEEDSIKVLMKAVEMGALKPSDAVIITKRALGKKEVKEANSTNKYLTIDEEGDYQLNDKAITDYLKSVINPEEIKSIESFMTDDEGYGESSMYFFDNDEDPAATTEKDVESWATQEMSYYLFSKPDEFPFKGNLNEGYAQFRNETKMRSKPDQFHQAVKQVKKKVNEINRLFEYMDRLKTELSEGEAIKNKKYTDNAIHQIKEETKKLFFKAIKLK
jgi:hypothetical protein